MFDWFPKTKNDEKYLDNWQDIALNFEPNQPIDKSWYVDGYEVNLGIDQKKLFDVATTLLNTYKFYPPSVMRSTSNFTFQGRTLQVGDRIIQRVHVIPGVLDVLTMTQVSALIVEPNRRGFTYITTENHYAMGEWTAAIVRKRHNQVVLVMHSISKSGSKMPFLCSPIARYLQLRAHRLGIEHFKSLVRQRITTE